jgi:alcohol dehydrogenase (cytochrome c)
MVWTRGMGPGIQEATPLVHHGRMYLPNPADFIQALDAATGTMLWEYRRQWPEDIRKIFPVPDINRNLAIYGDTILDTSADNFLFALDAKSGKLRWRLVQLTIGSAPRKPLLGRFQRTAKSSPDAVVSLKVVQRRVL